MKNTELEDILKLNAFTIFGLNLQFDINQNELNQTLHKLQKKFHPDNFINSELNHLAVAVSAYINACYTQLKLPLERSLLLLQLNGIELNMAYATNLPQQFLLEQMEFHERMDEASYATLEQLEHELKDKQKHLIAALSATFKQSDYPAAAELSKQLAFYQKLLGLLNDKLSLD